ncbi:MAG: DUF302 domain-containing protein [Alphaproteobacteria bacterium]
MIRVLTVLLLGALALDAHSAAAQEWSAPPGWEVAKTRHSYAKLIARLDAAVTANKMGLVTRASATLGAKARGLTIPGNMVIGVYHPKFAVRMLAASIPAGIEAPIRFYITENAEGTATLSYKTPTAVFAPYAAGGEQLTAMARELDAIFAKIAKQATAP